MTKILTKQMGDHLIIFVNGSFDLHAFENFHQSYPEKIEGIRSVTVDLAGTTNADSSSLGMLISLWKLMGQKREKVTIKNANEAVREILEVGQINQLMQVV